LSEDTILGPLTTEKRLDEIEALVEKTKSEGATVLCGGKRPAGFNKGYFYEPTIFDNVKDNFTIAKEEPFGPLVPLLTFKDTDEVVRRANDNELGLASYIYTNSLEKAHKVSEKMETGTCFKQNRKMKNSWYEGTTGLPPLDYAIKNAVNHGWSHQIERLMILSNIMNLCEIKPLIVYKWFMEMFVDSSDWVMVPNVYGMGQFADGGIFTTKPYVSGSNYVRKMSDYPKGPWCGLWAGLFWSFIKKHETFFRSQYRLAMMARNS
jgi:hypothetical protein